DGPDGEERGERVNEGGLDRRGHPRTWTLFGTKGFRRDFRPEERRSVAPRDVPLGRGMSANIKRGEGGLREAEGSSDQRRDLAPDADLLWVAVIHLNAELN